MDVWSVVAAEEAEKDAEVATAAAARLEITDVAIGEKDDEAP